MDFNPRPAKPYIAMNGLAKEDIQDAEDLRGKIITMAQQQASLSSWRRPYENGKFYIQHFKQAGGSWHIARAIAYPPSAKGGYDEYLIVIATGTSEEGVLGALRYLERVFEGRERDNQAELALRTREGSDE